MGFESSTGCESVHVLNVVRGVTAHKNRTSREMAGHTRREARQARRKNIPTRDAREREE